MPTSAMRAIALIALVLAAIGGEVAAARPSGEAAKRRRLSALETSASLQRPAHNVTARGFLDCVFEDVGNAFTGLVGQCVYGRYCGSCNGNDGRDSPIDELDRACFFHDKCYIDGGDTCDQCYCNAQLGYVATQVWNEGTEAEGCGCGLFQRSCSKKVLEAGSVYKWIDLLTYSKNCPSDCPDAPTGDECGANVVYETDLYGGDYKDVAVSDWHECCKLCASESECRAWTYTEGGCYMKDDSWSAEPREGLISGYYSSS